ncbi:venom serine protease Bi-VSP isoform X1 [Manduca sexta]|uniref:CLIP domain-containing serine protease n=1 Tax=Manduca sexta TaxID=7130 RepID=A0A921Z4Q6_MANSE|nr:venom serine protease Bi-VSP isoform X1 [Manduca sexta]KAG6451334.1 hypothetical protein O3G_MSEX007076 [Manduca sexta]KAG6451335.1 hypothetical protein O3G_MSEX007076 [Manduca sexta]
MKVFCVLLCLSVCVYSGLGQNGFFPRRDDQSPFGFAQSFLQTPNRLRDRLNGFFNIRGRPRPIIHEQQGEETYYQNQNNYNRPVVFPSTNPEEQPFNYPSQDQYNFEQPSSYPNQPNEGYIQPEYTEQPVSFPIQDNPNTGNYFPNYENNQNQVQTQEENVGQEGFNQNTNDGSAAPNNFSQTTKLPSLEQTEAPKDEDRFGSVDETTSPKVTDAPPKFESRSVDFGSSGFFSETCQTVENEPGSCINLKQCAPYLKLVTEHKSNPGAVQLLRRAHCGFEGNDPKVCCPRPGIPTAAPQTTTTTTTTPAITTTTTPNPPAQPAGKSIGPEDFVAEFPDPPVCGLSSASFSRVVGGVDAKLGDFPWMALLGYRKRTNPTQWLCGGSLISSKHVLTASHCIHTKEQELYIVRLGELDLVRDDDGAAPIDIFIKHMIKHEQYNPKAYTNDIGILVLEKEVEFSDLIRPICLPKTSELRSMTFEDYNPMVAGWGNLEARGPAATHLQVVQLPVVSNDYCKQAYRNYTQQKIDERVLCAGYKNGGKDSCRGDSGGPLMQPIWNSQSYKTYFFQIGVVSFGKGCAEAGFPGVYSRVTNFMPWLQEKVLGHA